MATNQQVRTMQTARPFRPFLVKLAGGTVYTVRHSENIACSTNGREMTVYDDDGMHLVEMLMVEVIEAVSSPAESKAEGNGE